MRSAASGAQNIINAVVEDADNLVNGGFYKECKLATQENSKIDNMKEVSQELWQLSEELTGLNQ